jgi:hypothetical protein
LALFPDRLVWKVRSDSRAAQQLSLLSPRTRWTANTFRWTASLPVFPPADLPL